MLRKVRNTQFLGGKLKGRDELANLGVDGRIIFK
jgi:hypothetical protein